MTMVATNMFLSWWSLVLLTTSLLVLQPIALVSSASLGKARHEAPTQRNIVIRNRSGRRIDILWINKSLDPWTYHSNSENGEGYAYGADTSISSYIGHEFEVREMPSKRGTKSCLYDECRKTYLAVNDQEKQDAFINSDFEAIMTDDRKRAQDEAAALIDSCKAEISQKLSLSPFEIIDAISECMDTNVNAKLAERQEEIQFQSGLRVDMAQKLAPYACGDVNFTTSVELQNRTWNYEEIDGKYHPYQIEILHHRPTSKIIVLPEFASPKECAALPHFVEPTNEKNKEKTTNNVVPFLAVNDKTKQGKQVHGLASRVYELARHLLEWPELDFADMHALGISLFDIVQDYQETTPLPICTGNEEQKSSTNKKNKNKNKKNNEKTCRLPGDDPLEVSTQHIFVEDAEHDVVATVFLFCEEPKQKVLGGIHFPYAGIHVNPKKGMLLMAIHRRLTDTEMDGYVQEYHLCPNYNVLTHTFKTPQKASPPQQQQQQDQEL